MNNCLWKPSKDKVKNSLLEEFSRFSNLKPNSSFKDIWNWSIKNPKIFWSNFWDFSKIIGDKEGEIIKENKVFNKTKFFPNSKLNYTENILKKKNDTVAISFLSENGYEESITWKHLYEKVCKFSAYLKSINLNKSFLLIASLSITFSLLILFLSRAYVIGCLKRIVE